ncbi:MAG: MOSC domain-containing protein [Deltaproteobacteria bacterium]|nr:MOSC domain-containing protein [Deltaproteobacteria bacterium]
MMEGTIFSINISEQKGTSKYSVSSAEVDDYGIKGDAHAGKWHRQISMLSHESARKFSDDSGVQINSGDFAENLLVEGMDLSGVSVMDEFICGNVRLQVTQIGKKCHGDNCTVYSRVGKCIMPKEGIFARVLSGGLISAGDRITLNKRLFRIKIITVSDSASENIYEDISGKVIFSKLEEHFSHMTYKTEMERIVIPDDIKIIENVLAESSSFDLIVTNGGTGVGPRDVTPEAAMSFIDKELPGVMDFVRNKHGDRLPSALLSRSIAGIKGKTQLYCLPGSPKACVEYMDEILRVIEHAFFMLHSIGH